MTDNEIIKALEYCLKSLCHCKECPRFERGVDDCHITLYNDTIDLINRQKAEIEELRKAKYIFATVDDSLGDLEDALEEIEALRKSHDELIAKNREQEEEIAHLKCVSIVGEVREIPLKIEKLACISWEHTLVKAVKAEAVKEFAGRLKIEAFLPLGTWCSERVVTEAKIDNLVEEMTEEQSDV